MTERPYDLEDWLTRRTWDGRLPVDLARLAEAKATQRVMVIVPALDEEATIGAVVGGTLSAGLLVDEVVVVDGGSVDDTAVVATSAGASVLHVADIESHREGSGKGAAVWRALLATQGDLVVLLDADVDPFDASVVPALLAPLLLDSSVHLVKAAAARPLVVGGVSHTGAGGRVTELLARPLLNALWPELSGFAQPLSGELAARRALLERLPVVAGYGLEIGMLIDAWRAVGAYGLGQVVLGERRHRHHSDAALGRMASEVVRTALRRAGHTLGEELFVQFVRDKAGGLEPNIQDLPVVELPPISTLR